MTGAVALDKKRLWREINRDERQKKRALLVELRSEIRSARARRKQSLVDAKERCRAERIAARERARSLRVRALQELREAVELERANARQTCSVKIGDARAIKSEVERARAKLAAEHEYRRDVRRIEASSASISASSSARDFTRSSPSPFDIEPTRLRLRMVAGPDHQFLARNSSLEIFSTSSRSRSSSGAQK